MVQSPTWATTSTVPSSAFDVASDGIDLGDLAVLDLRDAGLRDAHHGGDLRLGESGVLAQLGALFGRGLR
jgi:hypothetical protein